MKIIFRTIAFVMLMAMIIVSCRKEQKYTSMISYCCGGFLTTVKLTCINTTSGDTITAYWRDLHPDDTVAPDTSQAILNLKKNAVYQVSVVMQDETMNPPGNINDDILMYANISLLCFSASASLANNFNVTSIDRDTNDPPLPIGLQNKFTTGNESDGSLQMILHHQPNVKNGSCEPGSVDLGVSFRIHIN